MKKSFLISLFFLLFPIFCFGESPLLITDIQIEGETASEDFIKIYNSSKERIDISGFKLRKKTSTGKEYSIRVFPEGSYIEGEGFFIWANSQNDFSKRIGANTESTQTISKDNSIALFNKEGEILDAVCWGENILPFVEGKCFPQNPSKNEILKRKMNEGVYQDTNDNSQDFYLEREGEGEILSEEKETETSSELKGEVKENEKPVAIAGADIFTQIGEEIIFDGSKSFDPDGDTLTFFWNFGDGFTSKEKKVSHSFNFPGKYLVILEVSDGEFSSSDSLLVTVFPKGVIINEFIPNPEGEDEKEEWIEILNTNDFIVDISDWKIKDEKGKTFVFPKNSFLLPHQFLILKREITKISLNNDKDSLSFYYPNDILIEKVKYSTKENKEGESIARDSKGEFFWTKIPTPGFKNIFSFKIENLLEKEVENEVKEGVESSLVNTSSFSSDFSEINEEKIKEIINSFMKKSEKITKNKNYNDFLLASSKNLPSQKFFFLSILSSLFLGILVIFFLKRKNKI